MRKPKDVNLSYRMRLNGVPLAARVGKALGKGWRSLGERLGRETLIAQVRTIERGSAADRTDEPLDIVFASMIGGYAQYTAFEYSLAVALEARGHRVRVVLCDQALPLCDVRRAGNESDWQRLCGKCYSFARKFYENAGIEVLPVSELATEADYDSEWDGIVQDALLRHLRVGVIDSETDHVRERRDLLKQTAAIAGAAAKSVLSLSPDRVILTHGIYAVWGTFRHVMNEASIPVVTFAEAKKRDTWILNWKNETAWWDVTDEWEIVKDRALTDVQNKQLDDYLESRRDHSADVLVYNFGPEQEVADMRRRLNLDPDRPTYGLFTNVLWDAASTLRDVVFDNPVEWVIETVRWFVENPDRQLIVKIHPAEVVIGTNQPFASLIRREFPELPPNVRLVDPDEEINSWSVIRVVDLGLVHTSTIGLEMALEGIPCVVVSRTHYREKGFTVDPSSREDYFRLLKSREGGEDRAAIREMARRYAYLLFERYQVPFPFIHQVAYSDVRALNFGSARELLDSGLMRSIIESIERQKSFVLSEDTVHQFRQSSRGA